MPNAWKKTDDIKCPVCRYVQSPEMQEGSQCADCDLRDNLWICLICGNLGCGRYGHKHAYRHFEKTGHTFALELGKNMVWDYAEDVYVHRIAVNQEDGKLVQVGEGGETGDKKADGLCMEFSAVLVSQLESQRQYFESQLEAITSESAARICAIENDLESSRTCLAEMETKLSAVTKERNLIAHKLAQSTASVQRMQAELSEGKALIAGLSSSQAAWQERAKQAEAELARAQEEMREVLLNLELRDKLAEASVANEITSGELAESALTVTESTRRRRRKKNR
ncbi:BRCA1-associated protein [Taenia solium]|eukprot:TsM_001147700 transcript=TsM_001147700 gene=TsM_001147700